MIVTHSGVTYECAVAVKCENDNYIRLYDENKNEIASFYNISDFSEYTISGGSFVSPCDCTAPIPVSLYVIGARTITAGDWLTADDGRYYYEIQNPLISANTTTCNIFLLFAKGIKLDYTPTQEAGKLTIYTSAAPLADVVIESIQIARA